MEAAMAWFAEATESKRSQIGPDLEGAVCRGGNLDWELPVYPAGVWKSWMGTSILPLASVK